MLDVIELKNEHLPQDIDLLIKSKLFSDDEVREIHKHTKSYEYNTTVNLKLVRDFLEYIKYERDLLRRINERRKTIAHRNTESATILDTKRTLEQSIACKIIRLYKTALTRYPEEERLYENFMIFCKISKFLPEVPPYLQKFIQFHGKNENVWVTVIKWNYEEQNNIQKARLTFAQGIRLHPTSKELYKTIFKVELTEASKTKQSVTEDEESFQSVGVKKCLDLYIHSKKEIFDVEFLADLLTIMENFPFSTELQNKIVRDMMDLFPSKESTWHTLAQRELKGFSVKDSFEQHNYKGNSASSIQPSLIQLQGSEDVEVIILKTDQDCNTNPTLEKLTLKKRIEICSIVYNTGATTLKTNEMWTLYIDAMIELKKDTSTQLKLKAKCLLNAYKGAHEARALTAQQYIQFANILKQSDDPDEREHLLLAVLDRATILYPNCSDLWLMYMTYYMKMNNESKFNDIFCLGSRKCNEPLSLWILLKQYYLTVTTIEDRKKLENVFNEGIKQKEPIGSYFKAAFIEWTAMLRSVEAARNLFKKLVVLGPPSYEMYKKMIHLNLKLLYIKPLEEQAADNNYIQTRLCFQAATETFGKTNPELWIDYIKFEKDYGDFKNITIIYAKAKNQLDSDYMDMFMSQYELMINIM